MQIAWNNHLETLYLKLIKSQPGCPLLYTVIRCHSLLLHSSMEQQWQITMNMHTRPKIFWIIVFFSFFLICVRHNFCKLSAGICDHLEHTSSKEIFVEYSTCNFKIYKKKYQMKKLNSPWSASFWKYYIFKLKGLRSCIGNAEKIPLLSFTLCVNTMLMWYSHSTNMQDCFECVLFLNFLLSPCNPFYSPKHLLWLVARSTKTLAEMTLPKGRNICMSSASPNSWGRW